MYQTVHEQIFFGRIQQMAEEALVREVLTTPKPGLVDGHDNGSHTDMTPELFIRSAKAVSPYLRQMCMVGYCVRSAPEQIYKMIQRIGLQAESAMLRATGGVNTHKGAIYNLGLLSAAAGIQYRLDQNFNIQSILEICSQMTRKDIRKFFLDLDSRDARTNGEKLYKLYGEKGIRGEAEQGYPIIRDTAYPAFLQCCRAGMDRNNAYVWVLTEIIAELSDTNVLARSGWNLKEAEWMKEEAVSVLREGCMETEQGRRHLVSWNEACIRKNISPGGAADILASVIFLESLSHSIME